MALTDQKLTDIPSRARVQLTKPVQANNTGRITPLPEMRKQQTAPSYPAKPAADPGMYDNAANEATARGELYNPFTPANEPEPTTPTQQTPYVDPVLAASAIAETPAGRRLSPQEVIEALRGMTQDELLEVLQPMANGEITGRPRSTNSSEPIIGGPTAPTFNR